jgi:signal transduction histidine kinase
VKALFQAVTGERTAANVSFGGLVLLAAAVLAVSVPSIHFTRNANFIATFWPSNAIVLAVLLRSSRNATNYAGILASGAVAIFVANLSATMAPALATALAAANAAEVGVATALLLRLDPGIDLTRIRSLSIFILAAGIAAPLAGASIGAATLGSAHTAAPWPQIWLSWYAADALGMVIIGPFLLTLNSASWRALHEEGRYGEAAAILAVIVGVVVVASYFRAFLFIIVPVVLTAIFRFRVAGAAVVLLVVALFGTVFIVQGIGSPLLLQTTPAERLLALQIFLASTALWSFPVAAVLAERDRLLADLDAANSCLAAENERKSQMVTGLHRRLVNAEEQERLRLSHELHDQTGQTLAAALLELGRIERQVGGLERDRLQRLRGQVEEIAQTVHRISWELRPAAIDELGLASALANYASEWSLQFGIATDFHSGNADLDGLSDEIRMAIYRIVGEALTNVAKHARGAGAVSIVITCERSLLHLTIEDNGCGFDPAAVPAPAAKHANSGLGLAGMRERLALVGGELEVESSPGLGTTLFARIPLSSQMPASDLAPPKQARVARTA